MMHRNFFLILLVISITLSCCKSKQTITGDTEKDTAPLPVGYWNAEDSRLVTERIVKKMMEDRWRTEYLNVHKNLRPILIFGVLQNLSNEQNDTNLLTKDIEKSIIKGDLVRFVQSANKRELLLQELSKENTVDTLKIIINWANRMGANFVVNSSISATEEFKRKEKIIHYLVKLELINCETNQAVWIGEEKVSKRIPLN